jgi:hypothetical protein
MLTLLPLSLRRDNTRLFSFPPTPRFATCSDHHPPLPSLGLQRDTVSPLAFPDFVMRRFVTFPEL